jgi:hypothetical protein
MSYARRVNGPVRPGNSGNLAVYYLLMGLAFQVIYFGFPSPFRLITWLHVLGWPFYVVLGLLRWIFFPFAVIALVFFVLVLLYNRRR